MYRVEIISVSREDKLLPCSPECDKSCYFTPSNLLPKSVVKINGLFPSEFQSWNGIMEKIGIVI
jgi:hypothetical protein